MAGSHQQRNDLLDTGLREAEEKNLLVTLSDLYRSVVTHVPHCEEGCKISVLLRDELQSQENQLPWMYRPCDLLYWPLGGANTSCSSILQYITLQHSLHVLPVSVLVPSGFYQQKHAVQVNW